MKNTNILSVLKLTAQSVSWAVGAGDAGRVDQCAEPGPHETGAHMCSCQPLAAGQRKGRLDPVTGGLGLDDAQRQADRNGFGLRHRYLDQRSGRGWNSSCLDSISRLPAWGPEGVPPHPRIGAVPRGRAFWSQPRVPSIRGEPGVPADRSLWIQAATGCVGQRGRETEEKYVFSFQNSSRTLPGQTARCPQHPRLFCPRPPPWGRACVLFCPWPAPWLGGEHCSAPRRRALCLQRPGLCPRRAPASDNWHF